LSPEHDAGTSAQTAGVDQRMPAIDGDSGRLVDAAIGPEQFRDVAMGTEGSLQIVECETSDLPHQ